MPRLPIFTAFVVLIAGLTIAVTSYFLGSSQTLALWQTLTLAAVLALMAYAIVRSRLKRAETRIGKVVRSLRMGDLGERARMQPGSELESLGRAVDRLAQELETRKRQRKERSEQNQAILDSMMEAVFIVDARGKIVETNAALDRMAPDALGKSTMEAIRSPELRAAIRRAREDRVIDEDRAIDDDLLSESRSAGETIEIQVAIAEELRWLEAAICPVHALKSVVVVLHDITDEMNTDRMRRDFVANASHELRTPLTAIRGYTETLLGSEQMDPDDRKRFLGIVLRHSERLQNLVDDLALLASVDAVDAKVELSEVDVLPMVYDVASGLEARAAEKRITVSCEPAKDSTANFKARANQRLLDQVLINLIDNAIKYTPEAGQIKVSLSRAEKGLIKLDVFNTAVIHEKHIKRIFERFYRIDRGRTRDVGGTGLGLAIVRHCVERMAGKIDVASDSRGTTFSILLEHA